MVNADPQLEGGAEPVYDRIRESYQRLRITPGGYTELFTPSLRMPQYGVRWHYPKTKTSRHGLASTETTVKKGMITLSDQIETTSDKKTHHILWVMGFYVTPTSLLGR
jgi:hypothetical protein